MSNGIRTLSDVITRQQECSETAVEGYPNKISAIIQEVSQHMNANIWVADNENDGLENLCEHKRKYRSAFFESIAIKFHSIIPEKVPAAASDKMKKGF